MHRPRHVLSIATFSLVALACGAPTPGPSAPAAGVSGGSLTATLTVFVSDEVSDEPVAGASVDVGGAAVTTDASGRATLSASGSVTLTVRAPGYVVEHWIGVDHDTASVTLAHPLVARAITASVTGGDGDLAVSAATALTILRTSSPFASASACATGACNPTWTIEGRTSDLDVVVSNGALVRLGTSAVDAEGRVAIDVPALAESEPLIMAHATLPTDTGLQGVVGVPGLVTASGVALLPFPSLDTTSVLVPARRGPLADARVWYVVRGTSADGSGESAVFDRDVDHDGTVRLPGSFLAIPTATASGNVGIDVDPDVDLYVVEAFSGESVEHTLVLSPSGTHLDLPIDLGTASRVVVRAIDTNVGLYGVDLAMAESQATRIATLEL